MKNNSSNRVRLLIVFLLILVTALYTCETWATPMNTSNDFPTAVQQSVSGTVQDSEGIPIPGVHIQVKGTKQGTFTDSNGHFSVNTSSNSILVFSYMGFTTQEVAINSRTSLNVTLVESATELDAVTVNAGYYTVKERERTGSISKVSSKEIEIQPIISPLQTLEGRMPGVEIEQGSGVMGLAPKIRIRGTNSLRSEGNYPLYIIDGIPVSSEPIQSAGNLTNSSGIDPLSTLNLSNIESIEVLKDADATAIYGSRGANGVVLITSKKGKSKDGKTSLTINSYSGISEVTNKVKLMNTPQYISMRRQAYVNDGVTPTITNAPDLFLWDQDRYTDWQEVLFGKTAFLTNINMAISGGNQHTSFLVGGSYRNQGSVFPGNLDYNKITVNTNLNHSSENNKFQLDFSANYGVDDNELFFGNNFVNSALTTPPNAPAIYNEDGSLNWENWIGDNPLAALERPQIIKTDNFLANLRLSYNILNSVNLKLSMGYSKMESEEQMHLYREVYRPSLWNLIKLNSTQRLSNRNSWIIEPQIAYNETIGNLNINALVGATFQDNKNSYLAIEGSGFSDKSLMGNLKAAEIVRILSDDKTDYRYAAGFGRLGINFSKKYFINITGRRDGSSRFGPNKRFSNFWALGGAWIFSEEEFFKNNVSFLNFGKIRGSYGTTGNDQIGDYGYLDAYETTFGVGGLYPTQLFNPNYSWEINKKIEAALQLGIFKDRINIDISWYRNRSSNQLVGYPLPAVTGFTSIIGNLPAVVQNTGWEVQWNINSFNSKHFSWQTSFNLTFPKNKLVRFDNIEQTSYANKYRIGEPLNIGLRYQYSGIDPETGFYSVLDDNGDGRLNYEDRVVIKNMGRKYFGGFSNTIRYKGLSFQFLFEYIKQNNQSYLFEWSAPGRFGNKPIEFLNSWEIVGDDESVQKISQSSIGRTAFNNAANSSYGVEDSSFLRLKNLSLSYGIPRILLSRLGFERAIIFLNAQNPLTLTKYKGLDPQGGRGVVPPLKTITYGIELTF